MLLLLLLLLFLSLLLLMMLSSSSLQPSSVVLVDLVCVRRRPRSPGPRCSCCRRGSLAPLLDSTRALAPLRRPPAGRLRVHCSPWPSPQHRPVPVVGCRVGTSARRIDRLACGSEHSDAPAASPCSRRGPRTPALRCGRARHRCGPVSSQSPPSILMRTLLPVLLLLLLRHHPHSRHRHLRSTLTMSVASSPHHSAPLVCVARALCTLRIPVVLPLLRISRCFSLIVMAPRRRGSRGDRSVVNGERDGRCPAAY